MGLVRLASHLERLLDIEIPDEDVTPENFGSLGRILSYAKSRRA